MLYTVRFLRQKSNIEPGDIRKILLVKLSHLGDVIMSTSVLKNVRGMFPGAEITLLIKKAYVPLLQTSQYVDHIVGFDAPWSTCRKNWLYIHRLLGIFFRVRSQKYDLAINLEDDRKSNIALYLLRIKYRFGFNFKDSGRYLTSSLSLDSKKEHRIQRLAKLVDHVARLTGRSIPGDKYSYDLIPKIVINNWESNWADKKIDAFGYKNCPLMAIHAWAGATYKRVPVELYRKLINNLFSEINDLKVLLIIGPDDQATDKLWISEYSDRITKVKTSLREMAALLSKCELYVGGDTGVSHLAAALGIPTISLFGGSYSDAWRPVGKEVHVIRCDLRCSPCAWPGEPFICNEKLKCIRMLDNDRIVAVALEILRKKWYTLNNKKINSSNNVALTK